MKASYSIIILAFLLFILACKKSPFNSPTKDISGNWNWFATYRVYTLSDSNPRTPQNTGINEKIVFNKDLTWYRTKNGIKLDSGTYSLGHGSYTAYIGAKVFNYDSVLYYSPGIESNAWDYYDVFNDTLEFCPGFADRLASYNSFNFPDGFNGSKFWVKK